MSHINANENIDSSIASHITSHEDVEIIIVIEIILINQLAKTIGWVSINIGIFYDSGLD